MRTESKISESINGKIAAKTENDHKCRPIYNSVCAYQNCAHEPSVRLEFPVGFSALFCKDCARNLKSEGLARPAIESHPSLE